MIYWQNGTGEAGAVKYGSSSNMPSSTPPNSAFSHIICSNSTNYRPNNQPMKNRSSSRSSMSSASSTSLHWDISSLSSFTGSSKNGYYSSMQRPLQQRQRQHDHYQFQRRQQQQPSGTYKSYDSSNEAGSRHRYHEGQRSTESESSTCVEIDSYFNNNRNYRYQFQRRKQQRQHSNGTYKSYDFSSEAGSLHRYHEGQRSTESESSTCVESDSCFNNNRNHHYQFQRRKQQRQHSHGTYKSYDFSSEAASWHRYHEGQQSTESESSTCVESDSYLNNNGNSHYQFQRRKQQQPGGIYKHGASSGAGSSSTSMSDSSTCVESDSCFNNNRNHHYQFQRPKQQQPGGAYKSYGTGSGVRSSSTSMLDSSTCVESDSSFNNNHNHYYQFQRRKQQQPGGAYKSDGFRNGAESWGQQSTQLESSASEDSYFSRRPCAKNSSTLMCLCRAKISFTDPLIPIVFTHFGEINYFGAPAPTALPKPPDHWLKSKSAETVISSAINKTTHHHHEKLHSYGDHAVKYSNLQDDIDTYNLKLLLKLQL